MFEQLAILTPQGTVLYQYNPLGKKFQEAQINAFINQLIVSPATKKDDITKKFSVFVVNSSVSSKKSVKNFCAMFHVNKQPEIYFVVTYAELSLELNRDSEELLKLAIDLWDSLELSTSVSENLNQYKTNANEHSQVFILNDMEEDLSKYDKYLKVKYEESIKAKLTTLSELETKEINGSPEKLVHKRIREAKKTSTSGGRKWGRDGMMEEINTAEASKLDFSESDRDPSSNNSPTPEPIINKEQFGSREKNGDYLIKEIDDLLTSNKNNDEEKDINNNSGYFMSGFSFLQKHVIGNKIITEKDLLSVLDKLKKQLISKNVAPEAANYLADQVSRDLVGSKTAIWTSVENTARESLTKALTQILMPNVSVDLLHEIQKKTSILDSEGKKQPYVFSVVGVNGVGKSTNLSKLAFWLLQNNQKVLIVACDTFRSGAVEQLRVHVENLAQLTDESHVRGSKNKRGKSGNDFVELFEAGYGGSDLVTKIAKQAIKYAKDTGFDIVLMDTAGRRHNDATLMSPLKAFAEQAKPDKIIMVGEALVGTDSVQQAKNFNDAFGKARNLDFFIISKCDTVGEMLGTMVNMVYATGIPILFVGVGQTYTDLRTLSVKWAVNTLMS
ncbi:hypothetical protein TBLA_0A10220 [Henningerozyma blattae CBS 6284]|uniref:Signal recognition particle receptor subunit alpha homolog n=1 Tax=Henningerozyma blattae (strain ATCC 34711 / CBS 6284 / DSM 70876 / NBRC 10599 / NRRL Y-10934 / UCD 77-7) TaxID=1071380 RepID=I2GXE9_HENB6|nr:hypothetical protein TBLA_0A10220 [Tetrapisispora blattae CBS 6284]CCH58801.1 hypothetical protein TBLA_0A10220 [Tetrapisispora blattae CBS 6284]